MRTIEEIKMDLKRKWGTRIPSELHSELIAAQDERIKRLEAELAERKKDWQAVCAVMKGRNKYKKCAGLWKEASHE